MTGKTWRLVLVQAVVLIAIGSAVGVIDAFRRPINLSRATVDPASLLNSGTQPAPTQPTTPPRTEPKPAQPVSEPTTPTAPAGPVAPGTPGWTPTSESALPKGQITLDQARKFFDMGAQFVDTRKKDEYEAGHVQNAMRISLSNFQKGDPALLGMIPRDAIVIAYCNGGHCDESEAVARMISGSGYANVFVLHDGFPGWKAMGHPVQTGAGLQAE